MSGIMIVPRAVLGGPGYVAPSDRVGLAFVGTGKQARGLANRFSEQKLAQIVAGCDVDSQKLNRFKQHVAEVTQKNAGSKVTIVTDASYQSVVQRSDVDAVIVATPDHWHAIISIAAMKAGKDVFCEKPLAHTVQEGRRMADAVKKYGRVLQTGSMQRSRQSFRHAVELVRNGYLGDVRKVLVNVGDPAKKCDLPAEKVPDGLDWDAWVGPAQMRPYSPVLAPPLEDDRWARWRDYEEFGGGILADWGAHMFDIAQWGLGMDGSGPVLFVPPSEPNAKRGLSMIYDSGIEMVHEDFGRGFGVRFIGTEGTLDVSRKFLDSKPGHIVSAVIKDGEERVYQSDDHYLDWLQAIQKRTQPICDVETGHRSSSVCNLANIAYQMRRPIRWDPVKEKFAKNKEANKPLTKKYRRPYKLIR